jgi:hypothetical protein
MTNSETELPEYTKAIMLQKIKSFQQKKLQTTETNPDTQTE